MGGRIILKELAWEGVNWFYQAEDRNEWWAVLIMVADVRVLRFLDQLRKISFSRRAAPLVYFCFCKF
jgi:hypothetical protein